MRKLYLTVTLFLVAALSFAQPAGTPTKVVTDNGGAGTGTVTWSSDTVYILEGRVFVNDGDVLTIEPGTVIKGRSSEDPQNASVLVVARGAQIMAEGTAESPIIFTAEADDVTVEGDVQEFDRGLWGGVIVLGRASTNRANITGQIEGIEGDDRGIYGGEDDADNSGVLRYISIRHGGVAIAPDNEINGLTLGAVGSGTVIEFIEVYANQDDGVEWFGGTVNTKYLAVAFCGDDSFDYDEGFRGLGQFWFTIQDNEGDRGGEHDGGTDPETGNPIAKPIIYNATYLGADDTDDGSRALTMRDNAAGQYWNSIFADFGRGIDVEILSSGTHSYDRFLDGDLAFAGDIFFNINAGTTAEDIFTISAGSFGGAADSASIVDSAAAMFAASFATNGNEVANPMFSSVSSDSRLPAQGLLDPRPSLGGPAYMGLQAAGDPFFMEVNYKGAFGPDRNTWIHGWTALDAYGFLAPTEGVDIVVTDNDGEGTGTTTWTSNNTYILDGRVFVNAGDTLTIEAGTVIKGRPSEDPQDASVLVVARGAYIDAQGTAELPIIFTAEADDVTVAGDVEAFERGLWGGVIILGNASTNRANVEGQIEGIEGDARGTYGGNDDEDNSGILRYISIRHGGIAIAPDNEINGLTLGAVGSGTTIEYIEVFANQDDGVEWFGGTVNTKYLAVAYCGDDSYDYDEGFTGMGQYWFTIQDNEGDRGGEHDGGTDPETGEPFAIPRVFNASYFGAANPDDGSRTITFRDNAGGMYRNSIFTDFGRGIDIELLSSGTHSYERFTEGDLVLENNIFWNIDAGMTGADLFKISAGSFDGAADSAATVDAAAAVLAAAFEGGENIYNNPVFAAWNANSRTPGEMAFDPRPTVGGFAFRDLATAPDNGFYDDVAFKGAFGGDLWVEGWSALDAYGFLGQEGGNANPDIIEVVGDTIVVTDNGGLGTGTVTWESENTYILDGRVFVNEGDTLTIEPGTVIKGRPSEDPQNASVLVVARGGYIDACGTAEEPIIFTAESDDVTIPDDVTPFERGLWGGVIVLGNATTNRANIEGQIEGIEGDARGTYGGNDDEDNSGILKYISIRHGGIAIAPDNEINGLTLGGVGSGTTIEYIEVFANQDDGVEWFGGTVNTKYLSVAFCGDDSYDYDEGFRGLGQFWFTIQDDEGDRGGEHDGGTDPETGEPFAKPIVYNATYLGAGNPDDGSRTLTMRDNAAGQYWNSIFADFGRGIDVELLSSGTHSYDRFLAGDLAFAGDIFFNITAGDDSASLFTISAGSFGGAADSAAIVDSAAAMFAASFSTLGNSSEDPMFLGLDSLSRTPGEMRLDPRPATDGPAFSNLAALSDDEFYTVVDYKGAFGEELWIAGWTALEHYGFLGSVGVSIADRFDPVEGFTLYPNPNLGTLNLRAENLSTEDVEIAIFDLRGSRVLSSTVRPVNGSMDASVDLSELAPALYMVRVIQGQKMSASPILLK